MSKEPCSLLICICMLFLKYKHIVKNKLKCVYIHLKKKKASASSFHTHRASSGTHAGMCTSLFLRSGPFSCLLTQTPNPTSLFPSISCLHTRLTGQGGMGRRWELPLERGSSQHSVKYRPLAVRASNNPSPSYCFS